jgi:hypothetical protein
VACLCGALVVGMFGDGKWELAPSPPHPATATAAAKVLANTARRVRTAVNGVRLIERQA